eukprot:TRINITY_DN1962_c0_g1_i13.p1 TRINITY_DN1962_c0_g1~~TRINITY_DN1962_c0_g1_i13.p1  ORF type:complete len:346 (-),score=74.11 TRINITY_DN1962_c0_g1_i13:667-1704(-)
MAPTSHQTTSYHSHSLLKSWVPEMIIDDGGPHEDDGRMVMVMVVMRMMVKVMEDKAKNLQFEKATIVEQINSAFTELTRLSSLLEEVKNNSRLRVAQLTEVSGVDDLGLGSGGDEDLIQQLIKENSIYMDLKKENVELKQKIMLLEDQLSLLQEHNHSFDKYLIREKEKISVLETEKGALNDVYQTSLNHQCTLSTQFSVLERKLRFMNQKFNALEVGNPKFAMSQLESHSSHMFVHACTRLVEKQQLLKEALGTANPDIIIFVVAYLHVHLCYPNPLLSSSLPHPSPSIPIHPHHRPHPIPVPGPGPGSGPGPDLPSLAHFFPFPFCSPSHPLSRLPLPSPSPS